MTQTELMSKHRQQRPKSYASQRLNPSDRTTRFNGLHCQTIPSAAIGHQRPSGELSTPTDKRIEAERAFAQIITPSHVLPTVAAPRDRDREARIKLGLALVDRGKPEDEAEEA
jgi:hypothetical protein